MVLKLASRVCRFDLLHIMIDEPDDVLDFQVATHIVSVHQKRDQAFTAPYNMTQIQRYIRFARSFKPKMSTEVSMLTQVVCQH